MCAAVSITSIDVVRDSVSGSIPVVRSGLGSPPNRSIFLDNVVCTGAERNLTECGHTTINNCDRSELAGVRCEGILLGIIIILR